MIKKALKANAQFKSEQNNPLFVFVCLFDIIHMLSHQLSTSHFYFKTENNLLVKNQPDCRGSN